MQVFDQVKSASEKSANAMSPIELRVADTNDLQFLNDVYADSRSEEMSQVTHWGEAEKKQFIAFQFSAQDSYYREHYPNSVFYVITHFGQDVGRFYLDRAEDNICIMDIAILTEHRRQGIGRALLREVLEEAQRTHKTVTLHVEPDNPAKLLYHAEGFKVTGEISFYQKMQWQPK